MLASRPVVSAPDDELMPAPSLISSIARFGLSALVSLQAFVIWVMLTFFLLVLGEETKFVRYGSIGAVGCCLILVLFLGILIMPFVFRFIWKAMTPVVNGRIPAWKKLIISVLSSMSAGEVVWIMGMMAISFIIVMIRECLVPPVDLEWVWYWQKTVIPHVCAPICAGFALVAMIWFGYKVYRRLSAAELIIAGDVGRNFSDAVQKMADDSSVQRGDGSVINPKH